MEFGGYDNAGYGGGYEEGGFNHDDNHAEHGGSQRSQGRITLTPVTIKQINDATQEVADGEWKVNNVELNMVSVVGVVRKVESTTSALVFTIEDGTGSFDIRRWINSDETSADSEFEIYKPYENQYVHVTGVLKLQANKKGINQSNIKLIEDHNQVLYHQLSAIKIHLEAQGALKSTRTSTKNENGNSLFVGDNDISSAGRSGGSLEDRIVSILKAKTPVMTEGVPLQYISEQVGASQREVADACQSLSEIGTIYSGFEDNTFCST